MRLINNPCKTCNERTSECHATCEKYKQSKADTEVAKANEKRHREHIEYLGAKKRKARKRR